MALSIRATIGSAAISIAIAALAVPAARAERTRPGTPAAPPQAGTAVGTTQPSGEYAGEQTCLACHPDQTRGYRASAHGRAAAPQSPIATRGCESCHGPGKAHADSGGDTTKIKTFTDATPARDVDRQCLQCHSGGDRMAWEGSKHDTARLSCVRCHSIHQPATEGPLLRKREVETCRQCHKAEVQKLQRSSHMPLEESALECSSCHNPHGTTGVKLLRKGATINETCEQCHADKRGPHLWEHAPVVESCTTCHDPHGSTNDRMLVAKEPFLCQRCHVSTQHPSSPYDIYALNSTTTANRMSGRSCAACHQNIHGSNAPSGRAFLR